MKRVALVAAVAVGLSLATAGVGQATTRSPGNATAQSSVPLLPRFTVIPPLQLPTQFAHAVRASRTPPQLPTFTTSYFDGTNTWPATFVGVKPSKHRTTRVPVQLVALNFTFPYESNYCGVSAPTTLNGTDVVSAVRNSPLFVKNYYHSSLGDKGLLQFLDAYVRQAFNQQKTGYHVYLNLNTKVPTLNVEVPFNDGFIGDGNSCIDRTPTGLAIVDTSFFISVLDNLLPLTTYLHNNNALLGLVSRDVVLADFAQGLMRNCCILGFHTYYQLPNGRQPLEWASYITDPTFFGPLASDMVATSHEVAEFQMDPFLTNATPSWRFPGGPAGDCQSNLEVGDPTEVLSGTPSTFRLTGNSYFQSAGTDHRWHMVNAVNPSWYFNQSPSTSAGGRYDMNNYFTGPAQPC
jgi:hypothetical protein